MKTTVHDPSTSLRSASGTRTGWNAPTTTPFLFGILFLLNVSIHWPVLRLPYFWDEAGYFVPAARDLLLTGDPVPFSVISNGHPPLVLAYLALMWKIFGQSPVVTRLSILAISTWALVGTFRLGEFCAGRRVAAASVLCLMVYPVFLAQSSLAQLDLPATGFIVWSILYYLQGRYLWCSLTLCMAVLAKETSAIAVVFLVVLELARGWRGRQMRIVLPRALLLSAALVALTTWFSYHYVRTGFAFGNSEFLRYNLTATIVHPKRVVAALALRTWHITGNLYLFVLTIPAVIAFMMPVIQKRKTSMPAWCGIFFGLIVLFVVAFSLTGGAVLARYVLPVLPLVFLLGFYVIWRFHPKTLIPLCCLVFVSFIWAAIRLPPHHYSWDDNLAYREFVNMHQQAAAFLSEKYPKRRVVTSWPATDELAKPYLGYVRSPIAVVDVPDFSAERLQVVLRDCSCDLLFVFPITYEPGGTRLGRYLSWFSWWREGQTRFEVRSASSIEHIAAAIGGTTVWSRSIGQQLAVIIVSGSPK